MSRKKLLDLDPGTVRDFCRGVLLRGFGRNPMVASHLDDLLQDCALAVAKQLRHDSGSRIRNAEAWLVRVSVNAVYRLWHSEGFFARAERESDDGLRELPAPEPLCPEHRLTALAALDALDPEGRALLWERDALGTCRREMAEKLGISSNALGVRLHRARRKLLALLEKKGIAI